MTMSPTEPPGQLDGFHLPAHAAEQFAYHLRLAVAAGASGDATSAACEPLLAWAVASAAAPDLARWASAAESELISASVAVGSPEHRAHIVAAASQRAMELEAHYVSVGRHDIAGLYASVADHVGAVLDRALGA